MPEKKLSSYETSKSDQKKGKFKRPPAQHNVPVNAEATFSYTFVNGASEEPMYMQACLEDFNSMVEANPDFFAGLSSQIDEVR